MQTNYTIPNSMDADYLCEQQHIFNQALLQGKLRCIPVLKEMLNDEQSKTREQALKLLCNILFIRNNIHKNRRKQVLLPVIPATSHDDTLEQASTAAPEPPPPNGAATSRPRGRQSPLKNGSNARLSNSKRRKGNIHQRAQQRRKRS
ncbi:MAG: hypothetical protein HC837_16505 [Chloroflexaceae bacterium]|nr:hypothetical protein [Chloroflexaceae bacterium]